MKKILFLLMLLVQLISCSKETRLDTDQNADDALSVTGKDNGRIWILNEVINSLTNFENGNASTFTSTEGYDYTCAYPPGRVRGCTMANMQNDQKIIGFQEELVYDDNYRPIYSMATNGKTNKFVYDEKGMLDYMIKFNTGDPTETPLYILDYIYDDNGRIQYLDDGSLKYEFIYSLLENIKCVIVYQALSSELQSLRQSTSTISSLPGMDAKMKWLLPKISSHYLKPIHRKIESRSKSTTWIPVLKLKYHVNENITDPMRRVNFGWSHNIGYGWPLNTNYIEKIEYYILDADGNEIGRIGKSEITQSKCNKDLPVQISTITEFYDISLITGEIVQTTSQYTVQKYLYQSGCTAVHESRNN